MDKEQPIQKALVVVVIVLYAVVLLFNWYRLHYGVEISDEAYYVAEAYIVSNGAIPFTDVWLQGSSSTLLYSPIVKIYTMVSGGTEGIYLFMRQAFFIYKIIIAGILILLFRRKFPFLLSILLPLQYLALSIVDNFSYNTISLSLLLISCVLLFLALQEEEKYNRQLSFLGGILIALTILSHAMQLFTTCLIFAMVVIFERIYYKTFFRTSFILLGGILTGLFVIVYLSIISGGIKPVFDGIANILAAPYFKIKKVGWNYNYRILKDSLLIFRNFLLLGFFIFSGLLFVSSIFKKLRLSMVTLFVFSLFFTDLLFMMFNIYRHSDYIYLSQVINFSHVFVLMFLVLLLFTTGKKKYATPVLFVFPPFLLNYLLRIPFVWNGLSGAEYLLFPCVILSTILMYFALDDSRMPSIISAKKGAIAYICVILLTGVFSAVYMKNHYEYVYRDAPVPKLTYKMEKGVYKGLYTVEGRGKALIYLEDEIRKVTNKQDKVLFMDQAPQAYMMTDAEHCAPSTWDLLLYTYAFRDRLIESYDSMDDSLLHKYFKAAGKEPDKIIYVLDKERINQLSLWNENYRFNQYVEKYYRQTYSNDAEQFPIVVFERKHL